MQVEGQYLTSFHEDNISRENSFASRKTVLFFNKVLVHETEEQRRGLLAIPMRDQLVSVLKYMLDEDEFLSPYGIRSLSKVTNGQFSKSG